MSLTYTDDTARTYTETPAPHTEDAYVPVYARSRTRSRKARKSGIRSWMILAPVGVLVLGGAAAMMLMDGGRETSALAEPAATAPVMPAAAPAALTAAAEPVATPAPVEAAPLPRDAAPAPAPVRRAAPARRAAAPAPVPAAVEREAAPAPAEAVAETSQTTVTLNTAPTTTTTTEAPPPRIVVAPLD
ncbi:hypothetical protein [Brevundimonas sp.]|uniref:hypothetical protein n=1 Tax=Brevundimonas sp. TaxID=1871086 RepID=UPI0035B25B9E